MALENDLWKSIEAYDDLAWYDSVELAKIEEMAESVLGEGFDLDWCRGYVEANRALIIQIKYPNDV